MSSSPFGWRGPALDEFGRPLDPDAPGNPVAQGPAAASVLGQTWPARLAQSVASAVTAPYRAYTGDLPVYDPMTGHTTDQAIDAANDMAGLAMTGGLGAGVRKEAGEAVLGAGPILTHADDPLAALMAGLDTAPTPAIAAAPVGRGAAGRLDPAAPQWDLYHGTSAPDFARFDPTVPGARGGGMPSERGTLFFSPSPDEAGGYAFGDGARTIRATVDPGRSAVFDLPALMRDDPSFVAQARETFLRDNGGKRPAALGKMFDDHLARVQQAHDEADRINAQMAALGASPTAQPSVAFGYGASGAAIQRAREQGLDTAILRGLGESAGGDQIAVLTPGRVRSYYDPSQLLYGAVPAAAGLAAAAGSGGDAKAAPAAPQPFGLLPYFAARGR
ncbi:hypothetical protein [Methylobacterium sp. JK268]